MPQNAFENAVCEVTVILSRPQYVGTSRDALLYVNTPCKHIPWLARTGPESVVYREQCMDWSGELFMRSRECYFGVYFPIFEAISAINTNITLEWA